MTFPYFGKSVSPDDFKGAGWRSLAIRLLFPFVVAGQNALSRLMYEAELKAADLDERVIGERVAEAAQSDYEHRRHKAHVEPISARLSPAPSMAGFPAPEFRSEPKKHAPSVFDVMGAPARSRRYSLGRGTFTEMGDEVEDGTR